MEAAQRMVDEAAKRAGYDSPKVYHGSSETFTEFSYGKIGSATGVSILGEGFYFTDKKQLGEGYGDKLYEVYLKLRNPYVASADDAYTLNASVLENQGYDGVILETPKGKIYMVFENTQIKSADPVTYDDAGNVIPLSKRFDTKKSDIRFSKKPKSDEEYFVEDKYFQSLMGKWDTLKHGSYIKVGEIGAKHPLYQIGMPTGMLRYDVDKLRKNMSDHGDYLTTDLLKLIPEIIANPIAISEYREGNTVSVFGEATIGTASPLMVGVTISKDNAGNDISKVRTYNARKDVGSLITDGTILYLNENKKRTQRWFLVCGIQVPLDGAKFGFIRSIAQKSENVKRTKFTKAFRMAESLFPI